MLLALLACSSVGEPVPVEVPEAPLRSSRPPPEEASPAGRIGGEPILERPVIVGGIANEAVEAVVQSRSEALSACHAAPSPGKLLLHFGVDKRGRVQDLELRSTTLRHEATEACVLNEIRHLQFPELDRGELAVVTWPLELP